MVLRDVRWLALCELNSEDAEGPNINLVVVLATTLN